MTSPVASLVRRVPGTSRTVIRACQMMLQMSSAVRVDGGRFLGESNPGHSALR